MAASRSSAKMTSTPSNMQQRMREMAIQAHEIRALHKSRGRVRRRGASVVEAALLARPKRGKAKLHLSTKGTRSSRGKSPGRKASPTVTGRGRKSRTTK